MNLIVLCPKPFFETTPTLRMGKRLSGLVVNQGARAWGVTMFCHERAKANVFQRPRGVWADC